MAATREFTTLEVLRAIQRELLPRSEVSDLAEVLVSGIYQRQPDKEGQGLRIRMDPECRGELEKLASRQDRWDVYRAVSTVIQRENPEAAASFQAAVHDVSDDASVPEKQRPFAEMARTALAQARAIGHPVAPLRRERDVDTKRRGSEVPRQAKLQLARALRDLRESYWSDVMLTQVDLASVSRLKCAPDILPAR
jgi:hypothetical protein